MKARFWVPLFFLTAAACQPAETTNLARQQAQNVALVEEVFARFNAHDWEGMAALYSDPALFQDPSLGKTPIPQTQAQSIAKYGRLQQFSPNIRDDVVHIYPSGAQHVIVEFISSGTTPDGTAWTLPICTIFTIENGKVVKDHTYYDQS